jgi:hypothetical protein
MTTNTGDNIAGFKVAVNEIARVYKLQVAELDAEEVSQITTYKLNILTNWSARSRTVCRVNLK